MIDKTQTLVHLARYDGHLSRRFFRAIKQLADLRRDEREAHQARSSAGSYTPVDPDPYRGRYVPAQAPPPIDPPIPTAGRIGFRASRESAPQTALSKINDRAVPVRARAPQAGLTQTTKQTQSRRTPMKSTPDCRSTNGRAAGRQPAVKCPRNTGRVRTDTTVVAGGSSCAGAWPQGHRVSPTPKQPNKPNLAEPQWNQAAATDRPTTEPRAVSELLTLPSLW